jgi:hypothetical protein
MAKGVPAEWLHKALVDRVSADIGSALRRRPAHEVRLAGVIRVLAPHSPTIRDAVANATETLIRRGSFDRCLFTACVRAIAETDEERAGSLLGKVLSSAEDSGGFSALCAASFVRDPGLGEPLAKVATSRHPHLAFAAEVARSARNECDGTHLTAIAPKIKESHRITMCVEIFVPLSRGDFLPFNVTPALSVLRDAERHLGRWLVLAEVATRAQDPGPLAEAQDKAKNGPSSARAAWSLVAWALARDPNPPAARPTVELVARLSDRPSADRDTTFLFRLADSRAVSCRPMLEASVKTLPLPDEVAIRAAGYLLRDHDRGDLREALIAAAKTSKREDLRGMAIAVLWDAGEREIAATLAQSALRSRSLPTAAWAALVHAAQQHHWEQQLVNEPSFRRMQWGWVE